MIHAIMKVPPFLHMTIVYPNGQKILTEYSFIIYDRGTTWKRNKVGLGE
ncbi:hypothetical protein BAME_10600 [Bacillus sp. M 2-6]|nr:hypothetical protein BAME_10600 [Bacillus sp. M 2-6]KIL27947.1 hypothetical protein B4133_3417 [Bacillus altitudinis]PYH27788.1 hypothetical protein US8_00411 [Bacillus altitudinis]